MEEENSLYSLKCRCLLLREWHPYMSECPPYLPQKSTSYSQLGGACFCPLEKISHLLFQ